MRTTIRIAALGAAVATSLGGLLTLGAPLAAAAPTDVRINEIESDGPGDDWIEIHNVGTGTISLAGWTLTDDKPERDVFSFAQDASIAPGAFVVVSEATDTTPGIEFGLGRADTVTLSDSTGTQIDSYSWGDHAAVTYGRCPDGTGDFRVTSTETPGAANDCSSPLRINEVNSSGDDWVELVNPSASDVAADGLVVKDSEDDHAYTIPASTSVPAGGYLVISGDDLGYGLSGDDSVRLFDGDTLLDSTSWSKHGSPTWGRCADTTGGFGNTAEATPGAANKCPSVSGQDSIVINEIESNGGTPGDWVELYNTSDTDINVNDWWILDNDPTHEPGVIQAEDAIVPAGGFYIVEETTLGFGLGGNDEVNLYASNGELVDSHGWESHSPTTLSRCPDGTGEFRVSTSPTKGFANDCAAALRINEVNSSGDDWVELVNVGTEPVEAGGFTVLDSADDHVHTIADGTTIGAGEYFVITGDELGYGLGGNDSVRLFNGSEQLDATSWTAHGAPSWGRCPDGSGSFSNTAEATPGAANKCVGDVETVPWDGPAGTATLDPEPLFDGDLSGLDVTNDDATLYAVVNGTGTLYALDPVTGAALPGWGEGKKVTYPDGTGTPDSEGVTVTDAGEVFIGTERNDEASGTSRMSVLLVDPDAAAPIAATTEWNLNGVLPTMGANAGIETVEWISDEDLEAIGYGLTGSDADRFGGLFLVGLEGNGIVYVFELHADGGHELLGSIEPGFPGVMALDFSSSEGVLRAFCDEVCEGRHVELTVVDGKFVPGDVVERIAGTENIANEGVAVANTCVDGLRAVWFADDSDTDGHSLRVGHLNCEDPVVEPTPEPTPDPEPTEEPSKPATGDLYSTPGFHNVNGRWWYTACEPYSQTIRCTTDIWATTTVHENGRFVSTNRWVFNNLTYLPYMTRSAWGTNPLANTGSWTATDGREWRTECDTPVSGTNGCRTWVQADVVAASQAADGSWSYRLAKQWVVNNLVRFK